MSLTDDIKYLEKLIERAFEGFKPCQLDLDAVDENGSSIFLKQLGEKMTTWEKAGSALMAMRAYKEGVPTQGAVAPIVECLKKLENNETFKQKCAANDWGTVKLMIMDAIILCPKFVPATYKNAYRVLHPGDSGRGVSYNAAGGKRKTHRRRNTKRRSTHKQRR